VIAWALGRVWTQWIGSSPDLDLRTVAISLATLFIAGLIATLMPALGAASVHPNMALRAD
jgi:ABC-type antimicrobial peptide transport system permease subunit